jgi:hypothetical protein
MSSINDVDKLLAKQIRLRRKLSGFKCHRFAERIRISVGEAFKKLSPSNPISHESVFKLNQ